MLRAPPSTAGALGGASKGGAAGAPSTGGGGGGAAGNGAEMEMQRLTSQDAWLLEGGAYDDDDVDEEDDGMTGHHSATTTTTTTVGAADGGAPFAYLAAPGEGSVRGSRKPRRALAWPANRARCARFCVQCCAGLGLTWTFATFVLAAQTRTCWTAHDELEMLNKFNAVSFLDGDGPLPLKNAHSHNDYVNPKPLTEALMAGFCSVEGDVHLQSGDLFLGHDEPGPTTLRDVYVLPLARMAASKGGFVFGRSLRLGTCLQVTLLVDFKTASGKLATYELLDAIVDRANREVGALPDGRTLFQTYGADGTPLASPDSALPSPLRVIATGINDVSAELTAEMLGGPVHRMKLDVDHVPAPGSSLALASAWISVKWSMPWPPANGAELNATAAALRARAKEAHRAGLLARYWSAPDVPDFWELLLQSGIDLVNTDRIFSLHTFLTGRLVNTLD